MANNKVVFGDRTIMDITDTTAEAEDVASGEVFYNRSGERQVGSADYARLSDIAEHNADPNAHADLFSAMASRIAELEAWKAEAMTEYVGVEYLQSQAVPYNTQYINTQYYPTGNTRVVMDVQLLSNDGGYRMMGEQKTTGKKFRFGTYQGTHYLVRYAGQADFRQAYGSYDPVTTRRTIELGRYFKVDGNQLKDFGAQTFTGDIPIYIFAINDTELVDNAYMKLYSCQIYENDELVRNFKPCRHRFLEGYEGLYETVENKLYINSGTGVFNVGADTGEEW